MTMRKDIYMQKGNKYNYIYDKPNTQSVISELIYNYLLFVLRIKNYFSLANFSAIAAIFKPSMKQQRKHLLFIYDHF